jgi:hypothetical protein
VLGLHPQEGLEFPYTRLEVARAHQLGPEREVGAGESELVGGPLEQIERFVTPPDLVQRVGQREVGASLRPAAVRSLT